MWLNFSAAKRIPEAELNAMVNESLKDIDPDEELSSDDCEPDLLVRGKN